jgi:PQQ-like domain
VRWLAPRPFRDVVFGGRRHRERRSIVSGHRRQAERRFDGGLRGDWPMYHRQPARTGVAAAGPALGRVRRLWTAGVDGAVYAEPLVAGGRVIVATENDSVYAFDASTGHRAWRAHLGKPMSGGDLPCGNIEVSGITGTPVVDPTAGVVYAVTFQRFQHRLVALDLATGRVRWQRPIDAPGADPRTHQQSAALALARARVCRLRRPVR